MCCYFSVYASSSQMTFSSSLLLVMPSSSLQYRPLLYVSGRQKKVIKKNSFPQERADKRQSRHLLISARIWLIVCFIKKVLVMYIFTLYVTLYLHIWFQYISQLSNEIKIQNKAGNFMLLSLAWFVLFSRGALLLLIRLFLSVREIEAWKRMFCPRDTLHHYMCSNISRYVSNVTPFSSCPSVGRDFRTTGESPEKVLVVNQHISGEDTSLYGYMNAQWATQSSI